MSGGGAPARTGLTRWVPAGRDGWSLLAVALLLVAAAAAADFASLELGRVGRSPPAAGIPLPDPGQPPGGVEPARPGPPEPASGWLGQLVAGLALLAGAAAAGWAGWALLRRRPPGRRWFRLRALRPAGAGPLASAGAELLAAVDEAVARSDDDRDPRRAVIACWVRLEEAAAAAGTPRRPSDTATDLVVRLLRGHRVSEPVLAAFADAYRLARYAAHTVDEPVRTQARSALRRLRAELAGQPPVAAGVPRTGAA